MAAEAAARLDAQLAFLLEADRLKSVLRATPLADGSRRENSGEHSWHLALFALVLADHAAPGVRLDRVLAMLLLHDLVEIDAGDVPIHAAGDPVARAAVEAAAADRIFGLLPPDQTTAFRALWDEFEAGVTADAIHARSLDRLQPVLLNHAAGGGSWRDYAVTLGQLDARVGAKVARGLPGVWAHVRARVAPWFGP
jgi:putative hydrolase of HD superfamily